MSDETTDESNDEGKKVDKPVTDDKENLSELDKLKADNAELKKELLERQEINLEIKKLEAEKMVGGKSDAGQEETRTPEEIKESEKQDRIMRIGKSMGAEWANKKE